MLTLTSLSADELGITDLSGLEYASNLTSLSLRDNQITDFSPVAASPTSPRCRSAEPDFRPIPVTGLNALTELDLGVNQIGELSAMQGWPTCPTWIST